LIRDRKIGWAAIYGYEGKILRGKCQMGHNRRSD